MKARSFKYLTGEGLKNIWVNRLMSFASIGVLVACMTLIGISLLISMNATKAMEGLEQQNVVMVYFNDYNSALYGTADSTVVPDENDPNTIPDDNGIAYNMYTVHNEDEAKAVCGELGKIENIADVEFFTSEQALEELKGSFLEGQEDYFTFIDDDFGNPLSCGAKVTLKDLSKFGETLEEIEKVSGVDAIQSQSDLAETISSFEKGLSVAGFWIILILLIISLVIVSNTIRVTMYNRKLEISIMKAVGATDSFVRFPFIVEGVVLGLISACLSEGIVYFCYRIILETLGGVMAGAIDFGSVALLLFAVFLAIGVGAGVIGSAIMIGRYLRHEGSEFKAYN